MSARLRLKSLPRLILNKLTLKIRGSRNGLEKFLLDIGSSLVDDYWENVIMVEYYSLKGEFPMLTNFVE